MFSLLTFHFPEALQHNFVFEFHIHSYPWSWTHPVSLFPSFASETKRWNIKLILHPPSSDWTRNTLGEILAGPKQDFLVHAITTQPPTNITLLTTQITKTGILSLPCCFLTEGLQYQHWKVSPPGKRPRIAGTELCFALGHSDMVTLIHLKHDIPNTKFL